MAGLYALRSLALASLLVASPLTAQPTGLGEIRLGMPESEALAVMRRNGEVSQGAGEPKTYWGGKYSISLCKGRVSAVTIDLPTYGEFVRALNRAQTRYGKPSSIKTFVSDNAGGRLLLDWIMSGGVSYSVEYTELGGTRLPAESVVYTAPCD